MSAQDFADYLNQRLEALDLSKSTVARRADISRQTWYRLAQADIQDIKISTIIRLANALETDPMHLLAIYFRPPETAKLAVV